MRDEATQNLLDDGYAVLTITHLGKLKRFRKHWKHGREFGYPICCIFRFALESALEDGKIYILEDYKGSAIKRGTISDGVREPWVPCNIFHHKGDTR